MEGDADHDERLGVKSSRKLTRHAADKRLAPLGFTGRFACSGSGWQRLLARPAAAADAGRYAI